MGIQEIQPPVRDVVRRIESEYREMPGLCLTAAQAQRLWGLDDATCLRVLTLLVSRRILKRTKTGLYLRAR
jgi:Fic family protein